MSGDVGAEVAAVIRKSRMTPYEDGKGGWLFRSATDEELADALAPLIDQRMEAAKAGAWDGWWAAIDWLREYGGPEGGLLAEAMATRHPRPVGDPEDAVEMRHCDGCGEDYNVFEETHVGHEAMP